VITLAPDNAGVWQMHFSALDDPLEKYDCLKQVVRIHPGVLRAGKKLKKYIAGSKYRQAKASCT
jgi:hypothetical protein